MFRYNNSVLFDCVHFHLFLSHIYVSVSVHIYVSDACVCIHIYVYLSTFHMFKLDFWRGSILFHGTFNMHDFNLLCLHLLPTISSFHLLRAHCKQKCRSGRAKYHGWVAPRLLQIITWHWLIMSLLKCHVLPEARITNKRTMHILQNKTSNQFYKPQVFES